jgi:hypothetical protein
MPATNRGHGPVLLTTPLNPIPLFILPLFEESFFAQRRLGLMMFRMML